MRDPAKAGIFSLVLNGTCSLALLLASQTGWGTAGTPDTHTLSNETCLNTLTGSDLILSDQIKHYICEQITTQEGLHAALLILKVGVKDHQLQSLAKLSYIKSKPALDGIEAFTSMGIDLTNNGGADIELLGNKATKQSIEQLRWRLLKATPKKGFSKETNLRGLGIKTKEEQDVMELLLRAGASLEQYHYFRHLFRKTELNQHALFLVAAELGDVKSVGLLLTQGEKAKEDELGPAGLSPIMEAAKNGHLEIVQLLVENGAKISEIDRQYGLTPLLFAAKGGYSKIENYLLQQGRLDRAKEIQVARESGESELVKRLGGHAQESDDLSASKIREEFREIPSIFEKAIFGVASSDYHYVDAGDAVQTHEIFFDFLSDRRWALKQRKILEPCEIFRLQPRQDYNYLVLASGKIICGVVENLWELGVRHKNLANGRPAKFGGEVRTTENSILINVVSGTYTLKHAEGMSPHQRETFNEDLTERLIKILKAQARRELRSHPEAFARPLPHWEQIKDFCQNEYFENRNSKFCSDLGDVSGKKKENSE